MPSLILYHPLTPVEVMTAITQDRLRVPEELGILVLSAGHTLRAEPGACLALLVTVRHPLTNTDKPHALQILLQRSLQPTSDAHTRNVPVRLTQALLCSHQQELKWAFSPV